ncbi:MAG: zinc ribbon domain-containing protein [Oscillospiraceae bacterium]|nr:zinc ribbon domain-containing protein [Oscillospiraceae bacterium]
MFCIRCGTENNAGTMFCTNCGDTLASNIESEQTVTIGVGGNTGPLPSSYGETTGSAPGYSTGAAYDSTPPQSAYPTSYGQHYSHYGSAANSGEDPVSVGEWFCIPLWNLIPIVGPLIFLILMFVWAFGSGAKKSKSNWAKAQLIWGLIGLVLYVAFLVFLFTLSGSNFVEFGDGIINWLDEVTAAA